MLNRWPGFPHTCCVNFTTFLSFLTCPTLLRKCPTGACMWFLWPLHWDLPQPRPPLLQAGEPASIPSSLNEGWPGIHWAVPKAKPASLWASPAAWATAPRSQRAGVWCCLQDTGQWRVHRRGLSMHPCSLWSGGPLGPSHTGR